MDNESKKEKKMKLQLKWTMKLKTNMDMNKLNQIDSKNKNKFIKTYESLSEMTNN